MYVYFYMICNKSKNYIEYENNTFIGEYNGINFYLDKFIDKNSIFMTYISKSGTVDRGFYPLLYKNKIQIVDPFNDLEKYSTTIKFIR